VCQGSLKNHDFCHSIRVKEFIFLVILSEVKNQCAIAIYRQGSNTGLVHFVFFSKCILRMVLECNLVSGLLLLHGTSCFSL